MKEENNTQKKHSTIEDFLLCYDAVFNEDGSRKPCGREKRKRLIEISEELCVRVEPDRSGSKETLCPRAETGEFGSKETGCVYEIAVKALKALIDKGGFVQEH